jgi:hypothetical protein
MTDAERDASPVRTLYQPRAHYSQNWQGGHRGKDCVLRNQYRLLDGGVTAEVRCAGPIESFLIDADDLEMIEGLTWYSAYSGGKAKYIDIRSGKNVYLSRYLLNCNDPETVVDHQNGQRRDDRRENLHCISKRENLLNSKLRSNNTSGMNGIFKSKKAKRQRWILIWYKIGEKKQKSWPLLEKEAAETQRAKLNAEGYRTRFYKCTTEERMTWKVRWVEPGENKARTRDFAFTDAGLEQAIAERNTIYARIGNQNGIRKEYGDGLGMKE